jgi:SAM-dependent methyltransferase
MYILERTQRFIRGFIASYGPSSLKKRVWDKEYSGSKWEFNDVTTGDCVYAYLEKYVRKGSILDLGCGSGNTVNEIEAGTFSRYVGLDISTEALAKAARRTENAGRMSKSRFVQGDFLSFEPNANFDVILFRESMYHIPIEGIKPILAKYSKHLVDGGVFIVRLSTVDKGKVKSRPAKMIGLIESNFDVLEKGVFGERADTVIVFRPRAQSN